MKLRYLLTLMASAFALNSFAQTIYPIDRATMLVDGKFDFKVEFDEIVKPEQVKITINGKDFTKVLGSNNIEFVGKRGWRASFCDLVKKCQYSRTRKISSYRTSKRLKTAR